MRPSSASNNRDPKRYQDYDFDLLPEAGDFRNFNNALENCNLCTNIHSSCEVCQNYRFQTQQNMRGHRFHQSKARFNKSDASNKSSVFNKVNNSGKKLDFFKWTKFL